MVQDVDGLLLLGCDGDTPYAIDYCRQQKVYTILTDNLTPEQNPLKKLTDEYWMINLEDMDALEAKCISQGITSVYAGMNEYCLGKARELTKRLDLPFYTSDEGWRCTKDKLYFNHVCRETGMDVPEIYACSGAIDDFEWEAIEYPAIVKPLDSCGAQGVTICRNKEELERAYEHACSISKSSRALIQQYIEGEEYTIIFYIHKGEVCILDLFTGISLKNGCEREKGFCLHHRRVDALFFADRMYSKIQQFMHRIDYREGPATIQFIRKGDVFYPVEMNGRLEGAASWTITKPLYGFSALESLVNYQLGREIQNFGHGILDANHKERILTYLPFAKPGTVGRVDSQNVRTMKNVEVVAERFETGNIIKKTNSLLQIPWYIHVIGKDYDELCSSVKKINAELVLQDVNGENLLCPFDEYEELLTAFGK